MHKKLILGAAIVLMTGFCFIVANGITGFVCYKIGYRKGSSAMAEYAAKLFSENTSVAPYIAPKGDDQTGDVGHFGS
jgi:hypothetical protein